MHIPASLLRNLLGEMATMFVDGPEIIPHRLQQMGFEYRFPQLRGALMDLT
jgi:NAD dependent epimerase/dehydratase family enzyme